MKPPGAASSRERIVELLRRTDRTVEEMADSLGVTDNAVRLQLAALERDGVVHATGIRRDGGVGKPATIYGITSAGQQSFSRAYVPFLSTLLSTLGTKLPSRQLGAIMREVGSKLARSVGLHAEGDVMARAELASHVLNELGGMTSVSRHGSVAVIEGCGCPLSAAVEERAEVCVAVRTMLHEITGAEVRECCNREGGVRCRFELTVGRTA